MTSLKTLVLGLAVATASLGAMAQTATPRVDQREANQDQRIQKGVASGQLNAKETYRLEKQQGRIEVAEANAKADGKVTHAERHKLTKMQDKASVNIHHQKHDAQTAKP